MKKGLSAVLLLVVVGAFAFRFLRAGQPVLVESISDVQAREGIPVEVERVKKETIERWRAYSGTVEGIAQTPVISRVAEEVISLKGAVGDRVQTGEVLVRLARQKSPIGYRQSVAALALAEREVQRLERLFKEGAVSDQQLDNARTQLEIARANRDAAVAHLDIVAPISGVITRRDVEIGDQVHPGRVLMVIADLSEILVKIHVSPEDALRLEPGRPARLLFGEKESRLGSVHRMALSADPGSRLVAVDLRFENAAGSLLPGALVPAEVLMASAQNVPVISRRALHRGHRGDEVWVVDGNMTARLRTVEVGLINDTRVQILTGLSVGDTVISSGAGLLESDRKVNIVSGSNGEN